MYHKKDTRIEYQLYSQEYFSGADMHIYFGDIWVDEITNLEFQIAERTLPIFGYNSYTFDTLVRGSRQVQGSFTINFKSVGYLNQILENADAISYALEQGKKIVPPKHYEKYTLDEILKKFGKESFDQIAEEYENALWGTEAPRKRRSLSDPTAPHFNRQGFDIRIHYGPVEETFRNNHYYNSRNAQGLQPNLTVETINNVYLTSSAKVVGTNDQGAPVQETYTFIAQDINGTSNNR